MPEHQELAVYQIYPRSDEYAPHLPCEPWRLFSKHALFAAYGERPASEKQEDAVVVCLN